MISEAAFGAPTKRAFGSFEVPVDPVGADLASGWFHLDARAERCWWSDGMYTVHGLAPGSVVPTIALVLAHQHPDDRARVAALLERVATGGSALACVSRLVDFDGRAHEVVLSVEPDGDAEGGRHAVRGTLVLLDHVVRELARRRADVQLAQALESRSVIDQAKGVLAVARGYDADEAFDALRAASQRRNVRVRAIADDVVRYARAPGRRTAADWLRDVLGEDGPATTAAPDRS